MVERQQQRNQGYRLNHYIYTIGLDRLDYRFDICNQDRPVQVEVERYLAVPPAIVFPDSKRFQL
jgi:hypothetical protein